MGKGRARSDNMSVLVYGIIVIGSAILLPILIVGGIGKTQLKKRRAEFNERVKRVRQ